MGFQVRVLLFITGLLMVAATALGLHGRSLAVQLKASEAARVQAELRGEALQAQVKQQNDAVTALEALGRRQGQAVQAGAARAARVRAQAEGRVQEILATPPPKECEDAARWGIGQAEAMARAWERP